jgi:hypothetical protein
MIQDYACPECGFDGPHPVLGYEPDERKYVIECGDAACAAEFLVDSGQL